MNVRQLAVALLLSTAPLAAAAQTPAGAASQGEAVVVVSGEGLIKAQPDQAWVSFAVESRSKNPKEAQAENAKVMTAVQERLAAAGIAKDALRTLSYEVHLESDWIKGRQVPRGYVARNTVEVRADDVSRVGEIIDIAITNGVNSVHGIRFDVKNRDSLEREAVKRATIDARARAEAAAAGAGATLGRVVRIEEPSRYPVPPPMAMMRRDASQEMASAATPIVAGEIEIRSTIVLTVTLK